MVRLLIFMNLLFIERRGIFWTTSTPLWSRGNGEMERFMNNLSKVERNAIISGKAVEADFHCVYNDTSHSSTKVEPSASGLPALDYIN